MEPHSKSGNAAVLKPRVGCVETPQIPAAAGRRRRLWLAALALVVAVIMVLIWRARDDIRGVFPFLSVNTGHYKWAAVSPTEIAWPTYSAPNELWGNPNVSFTAGLAPPLSLPVDAEGFMLPCDVDPSLVLAIMRPQPTASAEARDSYPLVIELAWVTRTPAGGLLPEEGTHFIQAWLTQAQAREVLMHGVPKELQAAMRSKATSIGWKFASGSRTVTPVTVDPTPFFEKK